MRAGPEKLEARGVQHIMSGSMTKCILGGPVVRTCNMLLPPAASVEGSLEIPKGKCVISNSLNVQDIINSVQDDSAGATAVFIGMDDTHIL